MRICPSFIYGILAFSLLAPATAVAESPVDYSLSFSTGGGSGEFAPYYISSLRGGRYSSRYDVQAEGYVGKEMELDRRFSYGFGVDLIAGYSSSVDYDRYSASTESWSRHPERPSALRIQQLYGEVKWRSLFVSAGARERGSALLNNSLTSGDLVESGNARPVPQVRAGFIDFRDIPFTNGWVQIQGEAGYGIFLDDSWWEDHYNYYNYHITKDAYYNYKRLYFRTRPSERFSVTIGMQAVAKFGGTASYYNKGVLRRTEKFSADFATFVKMLFPYEDGGETFYTGNHLGSWDMRARYTLDDGKQLFAYFSFPWEDGSGIGKLNGWDGLWGLEYRAESPAVVSGAVIEYFDFTNQSGPLHFNPGDFDGTTIPDHVSGSDDYYNNLGHNSYAYYGMAIGTPAMMSPIYNTDGYPAFVGNAMRGFHIGIEGSVSPTLSYRLKGGYRKAWGSGYVLLPRPLHLTAVMLEANWRPAKIKGLTVNGRIELDRGNMPCNSFGAMLTVKYDGVFNPRPFKK